MKEKPLFVIEKAKTETTEADVRKAFAGLTLAQKHQFLSLRDNGSSLFANMSEAYDQNTFCWTKSTGVAPRAVQSQVNGVYLILSRFNHSCVANARMAPVVGDTQEIFAVRDIAAGEEIPHSYDMKTSGWTWEEPQFGILFRCECETCLRDHASLWLSYLRRRLIRGLHYLVYGRDLHELGEGLFIIGKTCRLATPVNTDPELKRAAESSELPLTSQFVYYLLLRFLMEEEGLLDDLAVHVMDCGIRSTADLLQTERNAHVARLSLEQETWPGKLGVALGILGLEDSFDQFVAMILRNAKT